MAETIELKQGTTFRRGWTLYQGNDVVKPLSGMTRGFPTVLTATAHGLPNGVIPVAILDVPKLATPSIEPTDRILAQRVGADNLSVNVDSTSFAAYSSGGYLVYTPPLDLTGYVARAQLRKKITDSTVIFLLTDTDGITLGGTEGTVDLEINAVRSAAIEFSKTYMQVELIAPDGTVSRPLDLVFKLSKEGTR